MPTVHTRYVTWISRGRRHHGSAASDLVSPLSTAVSPPGPYQAWASPSISWTDGSGPHTAGFAFWSVVGSADGASVSTDPSLSVNVGGGDVYATAWYIAGGGDGPPGVFIDAFDVNQGTFVDDDFVDVVTDPSLTAAANNDGFVPTASAEDVRAYNSIHAVPFLDWTVVVGSEGVSNEDLQAAVRTSAVAFAFYQAPAGPVFRPGHYEVGTWVSWGVMVDGGGPTGHGPVPPWNPFVLELAAGLALADAAGKVNEKLRGSVLELAAKQVSIAADEIKGALRGAKE